MELNSENLILCFIVLGMHKIGNQSRATFERPAAKTLAASFKHEITCNKIENTKIIILS